jgi:hypothetical protein
MYCSGNIKAHANYFGKICMQCGGSMLSGNMASEMYQEEMQQVKYLKEMWGMFQE